MSLDKDRRFPVKKGTLFGIGVGPGDPELLTLKAVRTIRDCSVIAVPKSGNADRTARAIVEGYLEGKALIECHFAMEKDMAKRREARQIAADRIAAFLEEGRDVGFVTLGDPATYSTYMYVHQIIVRMGFDAKIIPGITSYAAAAAALGIALCEDSETLTIIPAARSGDLEALLGRPGNKVVMKSGEMLKRVLAILKARGEGDQTQIACRVTMENERLYNSIEQFEKSPEEGYFTIAIVKGKEDEDGS